MAGLAAMLVEAMSLLALLALLSQVGAQACMKEK
jgi:hypothetical protein